MAVRGSNVCIGNKNCKNFIVVVLLLAHFIYAYESIDEALKNGQSKGDVILYGNYMGLNKGTATAVGNPTLGLASYAYMKNLGYFIGNIGLSYTSGFYKNFRAAIGFRAMTSFYDAHKGFLPSTGGKGDTKIDFFNQNQAAIAESFIEYFDGDTSIKGGRIAITNDWINTLTDGLWVRNRSIKNLMLEAFWVYDFGRIDYYQMTQFYAPVIAGIYNLGAKYYLLNDALTIKAYTYFAPPIFTAIGARADGVLDFEKFNLKGYVGYAYSIEHHNSTSSVGLINTGHDGNVLYAQVSFGVANVFDIAGGYIHTGKDSGWGSLALMGDNIDPFFIWGGKALKTQPNANLVYGLAKVKLERFNFLVVYGSTSYDANRITARQNELNVALEIGFSHNVIGVINVLNTHLDSSGIPTLTQVNGGIRLAF